jgi:oligosaccharide repeat unit polymerase
MGLENYGAHGVLRMLNSLSMFAFLLYLSHCAFDGLRINKSRLITIFSLFINAGLLPFYSSSRLPIVWLVLWSIAIWYYAGRLFNKRIVFLFTCSGLVAFQIMTVLRREVEDTWEVIVGAVDLSRVFDPFVMGLHFLDLSKTVHIIENIPELLEFQYGKTLFTWVYSLIPRSLWASKPLVLVGPIIGRTIYSTTAGIPPGIIAELYWNFYLPGIVLGGVCLGWLMRSLYESLNPSIAPNRNVVLVYLTVYLPFSFFLISNGVSYAMVKVMMNLIILTLIFKFIKRPRSRRRPLWRFRIRA